MVEQLIGYFASWDGAPVARLPEHVGGQGSFFRANQQVDVPRLLDPEHPISERRQGNAFQEDGLDAAFAEQATQPSRLGALQEALSPDRGRATSELQPHPLGSLYPGLRERPVQQSFDPMPVREFEDEAPVERRSRKVAESLVARRCCRPLAAGRDQAKLAGELIPRQSSAPEGALGGPTFQVSRL